MVGGWVRARLEKSREGGEKSTGAAMEYYFSVYFFAIDTPRVVREFATGRDALLEHVEQRIRDQQQFADEDVLSTVAKAGEICRGQLPADCDAEYFHALCWLAEVVGEKVTLGVFLRFRRLQFLKDVGAWIWLL